MRKNISFQKISSGKCRRNGKEPHRFAAPTRQWIWGMTINIHTETTGRSAGGDASRGVGPHRDKHAVLGREKHNGERMRKQRSSQARGATRTTQGRTSCSCALTAVLGESGKCAAGLPGAVHGRPPVPASLPEVSVGVQQTRQGYFILLPLQERSALLVIPHG